jgi:hypothetical protein
MLKYKNVSTQPLIFYGVTFNPNDIKEVPGYINHVKMIRVKEVPAASAPKATITLPKEEKPKATESNAQEKPQKRQYNRKPKQQ